MSSAPNPEIEIQETSVEDTPTEEAPIKVLIIDDDAIDREMYCRCMSAQTDTTYKITESADPEEALEIFKNDEFDCVLLDYLLPSMDGIDVLKALVGNSPEDKPPIIMLTGQGTESIAVEVLKLGAIDYIPKHLVTKNSLNRAIGNGVEKYRLRRALIEEQQKLIENHRSLQAKTEEIQRFYQTVSHELKTPITSIREFLSIILDGIAGDVTDQQREFLEISVSSCDQLTAEVNDLIDVTRIETGRFELDLGDTDIHQVVNKAVHSVCALAKERQLSVEVLPVAKVQKLMLDERRLIQVITNFLTNALKFTPSDGAVKVAIEESPLELIVTVSDTGCGISEDHCKRIFERLYQVPKEENGSAIEGLGLGLAISNEIAKLHGGQLKVISELGKGSCFSICLPRTPVHLVPDGSEKEINKE